MSNPTRYMPPGGALVEAPVSANPGLFLRHAGDAIPSHRVVYIDASDRFQLVNPNDDAMCDIALGVSVQSAAIDEPLYARFVGELRDQSFSWIEGPIFLGPNGTLTQTPPSSGNMIVVGCSAGPEAMRVGVNRVAILNGG